MAKTTCFIASSLEKVFPTKRPQALSGQVYAFPNTRAAVQLVYHAESGRQGGLMQSYFVKVEGAPCEAELSKVELIPSDFPCWEQFMQDEDYLTKEPGLFPDLLSPLKQPEIFPVPRQYRSLWVSFDLPENTKPGRYEVTIRLIPNQNIVLGNGAAWKNPDEDETEISASFVLRVGKTVPDAQTLIHTEWFYADCLADHYGVKVFSEEHWNILERFVEMAATRHGVNMLLTPVFTPPLDTAVGTERPTVQLVGVNCLKGTYSFDFSKLRRWTAICRRCGISYLEISHLFTQWGAKATPKIEVNEDGVMVKKFGWHVSAKSPEYRRFLEAFLPALQAELTDQGYDRDHVYYHISDEPNETQMEDYLAAKKQTEGLLEGCRVMDALSSLAFYRTGAVALPVPSNDHIQPFFDAGVENLWVYYCCAQGVDVPNRFFAMPSSRNRIMGALMYLYHIKGFLHWGYNYYYEQYSRGPLNPYAQTHSNFAFPSGDPYLVYPGKSGAPQSSIRAEVQNEALDDLRILQTLEKKIGREATCALLREVAPESPWTFKDYPRGETALLAIRKRIFEALENKMS